MKMGTILSPWRYEKPSGFASTLANGTKSRRKHYAGRHAKTRAEASRSLRRLLMRSCHCMASDPS